MDIDRYLPVWYSHCVGEPDFLYWQYPPLHGPVNAPNRAEENGTRSLRYKPWSVSTRMIKFLRLLYGYVIAIIAVLTPINK